MRNNPLTRRTTTVIAVAAVLTAILGSPAQADDAFGQHVRTCAQAMTFDGTHNPGMHHGHHGAGSDHTC